MRKGRIQRNLLSFIFGIVTLGFSLFKFELTPSILNNFSDLMSASLSFSSLATALFFSCFSLIPAFSNSKFILALQDLGTDKKIMDRLLITTILFFVVSVLSFIILFYDETAASLGSRIIVSTWLSFVVASFVSTFQILLLLVVGFNYYTNDSQDN